LNDRKTLKIIYLDLRQLKTHVKTTFIVMFWFKKSL